MCLPWLWVCGAPLSFALTTAGLLGAERLRRQSRPLEDARITEMCRQLAASLRISYRVGVAICDRIAAPILVGVLRPMILLPAAALAGWDPQQLEMVLLHELAHVRRYDNLVNLLQRIVESVLFFQPMVWIISGWVRREREHCCDELVVARTRQPQAYAEMLVNLSEQFSQSHVGWDQRSAVPPAYPQAVSSMAERPLVARIRRILKKEEQAMQVSRKAVGLVLAGLFAIAAMIGGYYSLPSYGEGATAASKGASSEGSAEPKSSVPGDLIRGVVIDEHGNPQAGATVRAYQRPPVTSMTKSGADGTFRLELQQPFVSGLTLVASNAAGTQQGMMTLYKRRTSASLPKLVLKPSRTIDVSITDASGKKVAGATVEISAWNGRMGTAETDATGRLRLSIPADAKSASIAAFKVGVGFDYFTNEESSPSENRLPPALVNLVLNGAISGDVQLLGAAGKPVPGVIVELWKLQKKGKDTLTLWGTRPGTVSDAQGRAKFGWLPADLQGIEFCIRQGDYYFPVNPRFSIEEGGSPQQFIVELPFNAHISGRVTFPDGKPATGILIQAEGMGKPSYFRGYARSCKMERINSRSIRICRISLPLWTTNGPPPALPGSY